MKVYLFLFLFLGCVFSVRSQILRINSESLIEIYDAKQNTRKVYIKGDEFPFTGISVTYDENSNIISEINFVEGVLFGQYKTFYSSGRLESLVSYTNKQLKNGVYNVWYENDVLKVKGQYEKGNKIGIWTYYNSSGEEVKKIEFDSSGSLINTNKNGYSVKIELLFEEQKEERDSLGIPYGALKISSSIFSNQVFWVYIHEVINSGNFIVHVFDENGNKVNDMNSRFKVVEGDKNIEDNAILLGVTGFANGSIFLENGLWSPW